MRKNIVLIDLENVQPESLACLPPEHFQVAIFLGANQAKIPTSLAMSIHRLGEQAELIQISGRGPNALDFHIAFYIGQFAAQVPTPYFHIVSKDTGFDPLIEHLKSRKISAARSISIDAIPAIQQGAAKSPGERAKAFIAKLQRPTTTRPKTTKTLSSAINHFFQNQLSDVETAKVIAVMQSEKHISIKDGKIAYAR
jgi:hypothetical protein